ncbi:DUF6766 family protein [Kribbella sp. NPDC048915]|uniref:DUF6766 family protein n=1 Tax=Kribbella sp. NPDC048915 TaxID=3155148 RepID=UPI0033D9DF3E
MRWLRLRALLLANLALFFGFLIGLAFVGHAQENSELTDHGQPAQSFGQYVSSASFGEAVFENWESEFLQMFMYILLTAYLVQKGSAESRPLDDPAPQDEDPRDHRDDPKAPWPVRHGSELILKLYENSLAIAFGVVFLLSLWLHAATGAAAYSEEQQQHGGAPAGIWAYLGTSQFWYESLQNWQSEFLAVAAIIGGSIYLRQRRSAQSKPVHAPHDETGGG